MADLKGDYRKFMDKNYLGAWDVPDGEDRVDDRNATGAPLFTGVAGGALPDVIGVEELPKHVELLLGEVVKLSHFVVVELEEILGYDLHISVRVKVDIAFVTNDRPRDSKDGCQIEVGVDLEDVVLKAHDAIGHHAADGHVIEIALVHVFSLHNPVRDLVSNASCTFCRRRDTSY